MTMFRSSYEGTNPSIRGSHVDVEEDIDPSIPDNQTCRVVDIFARKF